MLKLIIEFRTTGPFSHGPTRANIEAIIDRAASLEDAAALLNHLPSIWAYRGGNHVAIHTLSRSTTHVSISRYGIVLEVEP
jgi:hypothetical protein